MTCALAFSGRFVRPPPLHPTPSILPLPFRCAKLFNVTVDYWLNKLLKDVPTLESPCRIQCMRKLPTCFALTTFQSFEFLSIISNALDIKSKEATLLQLSVNGAKTQIQSYSDFLLPIPNWIQLNDATTVKAVNEFVYLDSEITIDCSSFKNTSRRICMAYSWFGRLYKVWRSRKIGSTETKYRVLNMCILPVQTYASETFTLTRNSLALSHRIILGRKYSITYFASSNDRYRFRAPEFLIIRRHFIFSLLSQLQLFVYN